MSLVPEHIDEAIKHLSGRSQEELLDTMKNLPLYDRFAYANDHKIKIPQPLVKQMLREIKNEIPKFNRMLKKEILALNKKYHLELPVFENKEFMIQTSSFTTTCASPQGTLFYTSPACGVFAPIIKEVEITYNYKIWPQGGFVIELQYDYKHPSGSNGYRLMFRFDREGKVMG